MAIVASMNHARRSVRGEGQHPVRLQTFAILYTAALFTVSSSDRPILTPVADQCVCPGYDIQLICTTVGSGITVWTINTAAADRCDNIVLRHNMFRDGVSVEMPCRGGNIVGRSLSVNGSCYTSLLDITVSTNLNGISIGCEYDNGADITPIGSYPVVLTTESFPPPNDVNLTNVGSGGLTFSWTDVATNCSAISYRIFASGCGMCPVSTNLTTVTCTGIRLMGDVHSCVFRVQTTTCADIHSNSSDPVTTVLQAANVPVVKVLPKYSQNTALLVSLMIDIHETAPVSISGHDVAVDSYVITYKSANRDCASKTIDSGDRACTEGVCRTELNVMTSSCRVSRNNPEAAVLSISATSVLGMGPSSLVRIDSSSLNFVRVTAELNGSIACYFQNQQDGSEKTCNLSYGECGSEQLSQTVQGNSSLEQPNLVQLQFDLPDSASYSICYIVKASDGNYTVLVEGSISTAGGTGTGQPVTTPNSGGGTGRPVTTPDSGGGLGAGPVVGIVLCLIVVLVAIVIAAIVLVYCILRGSLKDKLTMRRPVSDEEKELDEKGDQPANVSLADDGPTEKNTLPPDTKRDLAMHEPVPGVENGKDGQLTDDVEKLPSESRLQDSLSGEHKLESSVDTTCTSPGPRTKEELFKDKHAGQVLIVLERHRDEKNMKEVSKKFWIPKTPTIAQLGVKIRKHLGLANEQTLYLIAGGKTMVGSQTLEEVYNTFKDADDCLYIKYSSREVQ